MSVPVADIAKQGIKDAYTTGRGSIASLPWPQRAPEHAVASPLRVDG